MVFAAPSRNVSRGENMAAWVLGCPNCRGEFEHAKINDTALIDYLQPRKPVFPHEGLEVDCPNCTHKNIYRPHELVYRA
jgi:hypothetical protein